MRLQNKVAIVTGGARGIGAGISRCLAAEGARIGIIDLDQAAASEAAITMVRYMNCSFRVLFSWTRRPHTRVRWRER